MKKATAADNFVEDSFHGKLIYPLVSQQEIRLGENLENQDM